MSLVLAYVVSEVVYIVVVASTIHLHHLQEVDKFLEHWLSSDAQHVLKFDAASVQLAEHNHEQVHHCIEVVPLFKRRSCLLDETHAESCVVFLSE